MEIIYRPPRHPRPHTWTALLLIAIGTVLLGFNLGWFPAEYRAVVISWQMLLVVLGLALLARGRAGQGVVLVGTGAFFLLPRLGSLMPGMYGYPFSAQTYWPVLLIAAGLVWLLSRNNRSAERRNRRCAPAAAGMSSGKGSSSEADFIERNMLFNSSSHVVFSQDFRGGDLNNGFGELKLDLRKVTGLNSDNLLEINMMFGSAVIFLPVGWQVRFERSDSMFGGIVDRREGDDELSANGPAAEGTPVLNLKCSCLFGSIELKN